MPIIALEQTGDADVERGGDFSLFTRTADAELRERGLFIGESLKVIERAMVAGAVPRAMLLPEKLLEDTMPVIKRVLAADASTPIYVAPKALFKEITGYEVVRSALAVFERPSLPNATELLDSLGARRVAVLEDIGNSTNIGAIFRSAAALGMDAVLLTTAGSDPLYRRASRVSMGNVFLIPWTYLPESGDWTQLLRDLGFRTVAMALRNDSVRLDDPRLAAEEKLAIVMGTEGDGLASSTIASCDYTVRIPMYHGVDSLNVAAASAVAFYELGLPPLNEKED